MDAPPESAIPVNVLGPGSIPASGHVSESLICDCDEHVAPPLHASVIPCLKLGHKLVLLQPSKVEKALAKRQVKEISQ